MAKHPHIYIPNEMENDETIIKYVNDYISKENEPTKIELLKEENEKLKSKLSMLEQTTLETSTTQQELLEILLDMEAI